MPPVGFEPAISAGERPQTYALDRAATGSGLAVYIIVWNYRFVYYLPGNSVALPVDGVI